MVTDCERKILRTKLEQYEGRINHLYLDSKGFVTVGVGHFLGAVGDAQKLPFKKPNNMNATAEEIKEDYEAVRKQPKNRIAIFYKNHTKLTLPEAEITRLTNQHIDSFAKELKIVYHDFEIFPQEVRLALFDLIFNVGMTDLRTKWPKLNAAVKAKNWREAAAQSNRAPPVSAERNAYVRNLLERAADNAEATASS